MSETNKKVYELGYHILPTVSEGNLSKEVEAIKSKITDLGGEFISEAAPQNTALAYEIVKEISNKNHKFNNAYFGWIKFEVEAEKIESLKEEMEKNLNVLRFIIIKTVRENTLATIKIAHKGSRKVTKEDTKPMDEAEVDKKIDEIVEDESSVDDLK